MSVFFDDSPIRHSEIETWMSMWLSTSGCAPSGSALMGV
jgi:hypothetical protein